MANLVKSNRNFNADAFLVAMMLMYARCPRKAEPEIDGSFHLGEIGSAPEKSWTRLTPYSIARKEPDGDYESRSNHYILDI